MQPHKADLGQADGGYKKIDVSSAQGDTLTHRDSPRQPQAAQVAKEAISPKPWRQ